MRVPATTSNLGPGFDVLGLALGLHNEVDLEALNSRGPDEVEISGEGEGSLPRDGNNMVLRAVRAGLPRAMCPNALRLRLTNRIPIARGLGSSAAARLGGILAARALCGNDVQEDALAGVLDAACRLEGHPDNVVPALRGGLCAAIRTNALASALSRKREEKSQVLFAQFNVPHDLGAVVCVPEFELSTEKARDVLPASIPRHDAIWTAGRVALLVRAVEHRDFRWLRLVMQDVLHQPYRRKLVPGMTRVIDAALRAGAYGASLSGAGPSIFAFAPRGPRRAAIGRAMQKAFARAHVKSRALVLEIDRRGAVARIAA